MSANRPTRRSFLQGEAAAREWTAEAPHGGDNSLDTPTAAARASSPPLAVDRSMLLVSVRRRAMACEFEVQLAATRNDESMEHVFAALDLVEALETQLTVYRDDSEVIRINRQAQSQPVAVEPRLFELFEQAATLHRDTDGAFDITSGPLSQAWGFFRREGRVPSNEEITAGLKRVGMQHIALDKDRKTIAFRQAGVSVNFNSMGKGYALDRMAELLAEREVDDYLIHGGKSSVLARGDQPGYEGEGWTVGLRHPLRPAERLAEFQLRDQSLSTSGSGTQFFIRRGRRYGHILDPRTGRPAEGLYSATVIAPTACEADALSTAFYVMGPEKVSAFCSTRPEIAALLVAPSEREGDVRLCAFGLKDEQWTQLTDR
ncbi:MAG TPA: FAD:protein FMN transferase [Lacipirellulaceae bacterium]|nr:FAD:protein FMN transferase [Lacipirellulaceae bacterium]